MKNPWNTDLCVKALHFAAQAHANQKVPGTKLSYLVHLSSVCLEVMVVLKQRDDLDADLTLQCALLHDVIEDTEVTYQQVEQEFGKSMAEGILALTKDSSIEKDKRLQDSLLRIQKQPHEIWIVKLADRITNLRPPPNFWSPSKIEEYYQQSKQIYEMLKSADTYLANRLAEKIREYEKHLKYDGNGSVRVTERFSV